MVVLLLILGLVLILKGASWLTDGASSVASRFRIPPLVIGLTIVAFGTSAPELVVTLSAALKGGGDMAIGNVIGSNIFNSLLIIGCTALVAPIVLTKSSILKDIPLVILASVVLFIQSNDMLFDGSAVNRISRSDGLILLCFFLLFLGYTFSVAMSNRENESVGNSTMSWAKALLLIGLGLAGLIIGGNLFVESASTIARRLGVNEALIGLTLVAGGTSIPELATSVVAALKKNPEIAVGNVIGSNIFNIFFVLGCGATVSPMAVLGLTTFDFYSLVLSSIALWFFGIFFGKRIIKRTEGVVFILLYFAYLAVLVYQL